MWNWLTPSISDNQCGKYIYYYSIVCYIFHLVSYMFSLFSGYLKKSVINKWIMDIIRNIHSLNRLLFVSNCEHIELTFKATDKLHNSSDFCQWSGLSLETSAVTLVWDDGKWVKAHKDKLCVGSDE